MRGGVATWLEAAIDGSEAGITGEMASGGAPRIRDVILAWRAAERELAGLVEADPKRERVRAELVSLRAIHHRLFAARMAESPAGRTSSARWELAVLAWGSAPLPARVMA
jgi:hypothetical protein